MSDTPGIGHNSADLGEVLKDAIDPHRERINALLAAAKEAFAADEATVNQCLTLAAQLKAEADKLEAKRKDIKEPVIAAGKRIDGTFSALTDPLTQAAEVVVDVIAGYCDVHKVTETFSNDYGVKAVFVTGYAYRVTDAKALAEYLARKHTEALTEAMAKLISTTHGKPSKSNQPIIPGVVIDTTSKISIR